MNTLHSRRSVTALRGATCAAAWVGAGYIGVPGNAPFGRISSMPARAGVVRGSLERYAAAH